MKWIRLSPRSSDWACPDFLRMTGSKKSVDGIIGLHQTGAMQFQSNSADRNYSGSLYGGQLICQALAAACMTAKDWPLCSMHCYFLAPTSINIPVDYYVENLRDGRSFSQRQVVAKQSGKVIFHLTCSFHIGEHGFEHQKIAMPDVPAPENVQPLNEFVREHRNQLPAAAVRNFGERALPVEIRPVNVGSYFFQRTETTQRSFWLRLKDARAIENQQMQRCLLAYCSDYWLAGCGAMPHIFPTNSDELQISSLDHAMWFHRDGRCDDWVLYQTSSASAQQGRCIANGNLFDRQGILLATTAQESLLRRLQSKPIKGILS